MKQKLQVKEAWTEVVVHESPLISVVIKRPAKNGIIKPSPPQENRHSFAVACRNHKKMLRQKREIENTPLTESALVGKRKARNGFLKSSEFTQRSTVYNLQGQKSAKRQRVSDSRLPSVLDCECSNELTKEQGDCELPQFAKEKGKCPHVHNREKTRLHDVDSNNNSEDVGKQCHLLHTVLDKLDDSEESDSLAAEDDSEKFHTLDTISRERDKINSEERNTVSDNTISMQPDKKDSEQFSHDTVSKRSGKRDLEQLSPSKTASNQSGKRNVKQSPSKTASNQSDKRDNEQSSLLHTLSKLFGKRDSKQSSPSKTGLKQSHERDSVQSPLLNTASQQTDEQESEKYHILCTVPNPEKKDIPLIVCSEDEEVLLDSHKDITSPNTQVPDEPVVTYSNETQEEEPTKSANSYCRPIKTLPEPHSQTKRPGNKDKEPSKSANSYCRPIKTLPEPHSQTKRPGNKDEEPSKSANSYCDLLGSLSLFPGLLVCECGSGNVLIGLQYELARPVEPPNAKHKSHSQTKRPRNKQRSRTRSWKVISQDNRVIYQHALQRTKYGHKRKASKGEKLVADEISKLIMCT